MAASLSRPNVLLNGTPTFFMRSSPSTPPPAPVPAEAAAAYVVDNNDNNTSDCVYGVPLALSNRSGRTVRCNVAGIEERCREGKTVMGTVVHRDAATNINNTQSGSSGNVVEARPHPKRCACGGFRNRGRGFLEPHCLQKPESTCSMQ